MFIGATNAFTGEEGKSHGRAFQEVAREHKANGQRWVVFGDENYGEGSSREHAAMSPRFLGAAAVIVKGFARIHETNLKKQGVLALTFADPAADYDKVQEEDQVSVVGLGDLAPGEPVTVLLKHSDGSTDELSCTHTLTEQQIEWFQEGSALAWIGKQG